jgi:hypothetical protein
MNLYNFCLFVTFFQRNKNKREVVSKLGPCMYREEENNIYIYANYSYNCFQSFSAKQHLGRSYSLARRGQPKGFPKKKKLKLKFYRLFFLFS